MACFEDLSDDVLYLILNHLHLVRLPTLRCLRLVSQRFNDFADSVLYRKIVLEEDTVLQEQASYRTIERLLDPTDALRQHARFFHVNSFKGDLDSSCMNVALLIACLRNVRKLDSFSWDAEIPLPDSLLTALRQCHPGAQICVSLKLYDHAAVSSAQLYRLSASIPCSDVSHPESLAPFEQLRYILVQSSSLRALTVDIYQDFYLRRAAEEKVKRLKILAQRSAPVLQLSNMSWTPFPDYLVASDSPASINTINKVQIPLVTTDRLPPLEELEIKARTYVFDRVHCKLLHQCMDWKKLKRLRLGSSYLVIFFEIFTGEIPHLQLLDFSYQSDTQRYYHYRGEPSLKECSTFVSSLNMLRTLIIRCDLVDFTSNFWHKLAATHGDRLQSLSLQARYEALDAPIYRGLLSNSLDSFNTLKTLELAMATSSPLYGVCNNCSDFGHISSTEYINTIPFVASLQTLRISIRAHPCDEKTLHAYTANHAHCAIRTLWAIYLNQPTLSELEVFSLYLSRWENPSRHLDENGMARRAYLNKIVFDSVRKEHQLVVKAHGDQKTITTTYDEVLRRDEGHELRVTHVARVQDNMESLLSN